MQNSENPGGSGRGSQRSLDDPQGTTHEGTRHAGLSEAHREFLAGQAVDVELAERLGVRSLLERADNPQDGTVWENFANHPAILFPWTAPTGEVEYQVRPDDPTEDSRGRKRKYMWRKDARITMWAVRPIDADTERVMVVEGTKQALSAASYAPPGTAVYGIGGCRMWQKDGTPIPDLAALSGHAVVIVLDSDAATNAEVYKAGMELRQALELEGASKVTFGRLPGSGDKSGLDDVLAGRPEQTRAAFLENLLKQAKSVKPADKAPDPKRKGTPVPAGAEPLDVTNPADSVDWLRKSLGRGKLAGYFMRDGQLVHTPAEGEEGYRPTSTEQDEEGHTDSDGPVQVRSASPEHVAARAGHEFWCYQESDKGGKSHALFPLAASKTALADTSLLPFVRSMRGVTHTPLVRRDGSILDTPGYDRATGLYYLPIGGVEALPVPDAPTRDQVRAAVALLDEVVWDFPWRSPDHRANFLGVLLTPLLRELCPPPYKLAVFDAPQSRSGKTLLSKVARTLHGGVVRASIPTDEAEWSKTISTILNVTVAPIVTFDNVRGEVVSGVLDGLLTEKQFDARQLGSTNDLIQRANDRIWSITSNNAKIGGDLVKRSLWVSINPKRSNPEERTGFRHDDLVGWVEDHRAELMAALLTLVRAWVVAGRPAPSQPGTDIYKHWTSTVRAVLEYAEVPGMFDRPDSKRQPVSDEEQDWTTFLSAAHRVFGSQVWTVRQLLEAVDKTVGLMDAVETIHPDELPSNFGEKHMAGFDVSKGLGKYMGFKADAWVNGFMAERAGTTPRNKVGLWKVSVEDIGTDSDGSDTGFQNLRAASGEESHQEGESAHILRPSAGFAGCAGSAQTHAHTEKVFSGSEHVVTGVESSSVDSGRGQGEPAKPANPAPVAEVPSSPEPVRSFCDFGNWDHTGPDVPCDFCDE